MRGRVFWLFVFILACSLAVGSANLLWVQRVASHIIESDSRSAGIEVWAHYSYWVDPTNVVFDLRTVSGTTSEADVTRILFRFSEEMKERKFNRVYLAFKGQRKFFIDGSDFQELGTQITYQNPIYLIRTLPQHLKTLSGQEAFGNWTGGWLGVISKQMEDFNQFHKDWYLNDLVAESLWQAKHP